MLERVAPTTSAAMAEHWNSRAWKFDGAASHRREAGAWRAVFKAALGHASLDVVDLGCGTGACALLAGSLGHRVTAVDGSAEMLRHARASVSAAGLSIDFIHATMDEAVLPTASADVVTLRNVLWTLESQAAALAVIRHASVAAWPGSGLRDGRQTHDRWRVRGLNQSWSTAIGIKGAGGMILISPVSH